MSKTEDLLANIRAIIPGLNASSAGIIPRILEAVGTFMDEVSLEAERSIEVIEERVRELRPTTPNWYISKAYEFQYGDNLVIKDQSTQEPGYAVISPEKQIIKQAIIGTDLNGTYWINVATTDADGNLVQLDADQLSEFRTYFIKMTGFGATITVSSNPIAVFNADRLIIRYSALYSLSEIKDQVKTLLRALQVDQRYLQVVYVNQIETALIDGIEGVVDAYFSNIVVTQDGATESPTDGAIRLQTAGFNFDPTFFDDASGKIEYIASDEV